MTAFKANFGDLLAPGFRDIFFDRFNQYPEEYTELFNMETTERAYEDDSSLSGLGLVPQKAEGVGIFYDDPIQGYDKRYTPTTFGMGFRVTREMWEDDLYGKMNKMPKALSRSMKQTIEIDGANVYNRGFNSSYTGGDGKELFSTSHPIPGGGTEQNTLSSQADFSLTSLEQAFIDIAATVDERNLLVALRPRKLVVGPSLDWTASKILESSQTPGDANNDKNPAKGRLPYIVNHYLTDTDAWYILCDDHAVNWFWRRKPDFEKGNDFDTEDAKFKATARWANGFSDFRGVFASQGV